MVSDWQTVLTLMGVKPTTARAWAPVFAGEVGPSALSRGIDELNDFLAQIMHESAMLERVEENLNYTSADRICAVWPSRFKTPTDAAPFVRNPAKLANKVYGGRMGNAEAGDGWKYRGRGLLQVTGRDNYRAVGKALGLPLEENPDLLAQKEIALRASLAWWEKNIPDAIIGDVERITRRVNGGVAGMAHRVQLAQLARKILA